MSKFNILVWSFPCACKFFKIFEIISRMKFHNFLFNTLQVYTIHYKFSDLELVSSI